MPIVERGYIYWVAFIFDVKQQQNPPLPNIPRLINLYSSDSDYDWRINNWLYVNQSDFSYNALPSVQNIVLPNPAEPDFTITGQPDQHPTAGDILSFPPQNTRYKAVPRAYWFLLYGPQTAAGALQGPPGPPGAAGTSSLGILPTYPWSTPYDTEACISRITLIVVKFLLKPATFVISETSELPTPLNPG